MNKVKKIGEMTNNELNIKTKLSFHQILDINDIHFANAINIYNESFPSNEKQPISLIKKRITDSKSNLFVGLLNEDVICMALLWDFKELEFVLLDYMAVAKEYRNNNFGTLLFKFLTNNVNKCKKYMIIEVENYLFGNNKDLRKKRINFYIRNGAYVLNEIPYMLPSLNNTVPTEMILMISPKYQKNMIEFEKIEKLIKQLYKDLYGKTENNNLLVSILKNTPDKISFNNKIIL
jgi:ribosomal protein S18 acetylase RimI-like enzyme